MLHSSGVKFQNDSLNLNVGSKGTFKTTSNIDFATQLRRVMSQGTAAMSNAASAAAPLVPGASVVSAVLSNASGSLIGPDNGSVNQNPNSLMNFEQMQKNMMTMNMQMISVQREFQQMSEQYTMVSNVLKTKHDAEKNAIGNIR